MRHAARALVIAAAAGAIGLAAQAQTLSVATGISGAEPEDVRLERSGFKPIEELAREGRTVRRVSYRDPYDIPTAPSVTLEKTADGQFTFSVSGNYGKVKEAGTFSAAEWEAITTLDPALAPPAAGRTPVNVEPCFGKFMVIEAAQDGKTRRREVSACGQDAWGPALAYAYKVAEVAVNKLDKCENQTDVTRDPSWALAECMKPVGRRVGDRRRSQD